MRRLSSTTWVIMATVVTSTVALAQTRPVTPPRQARAGQPPANRDSQPPRVRRVAPDGQPAMTPGPASNLLRMRERLELTDDQVKRLEALQVAPRPERNEAEVLRAQADLMDATKGDVNLEKARAALDRMARVRTDEQLAQLKIQQDLRNVLTPAQRARLQSFRGDEMRMRGNQRLDRSRGPQMRGGARGGQGMGRFGPQMRGRGGPVGPPNGRGMGPGIRQRRGPGQEMGPGMSMGPGGMGGMRGMDPRGQMGPGMGQGRGRGMGPGQVPEMAPGRMRRIDPVDPIEPGGLIRRRPVPPEARPPVPPDTLR